MSNRWKKVLVLLSGYINFVAFAIVGGYIFVKSDNEDVKKNGKVDAYFNLNFHGYKRATANLQPIWRNV